MHRRLALAAASLALLAACGVDKAKEGSALMRPGENCLACHGFTVAGTVYAPADDPKAPNQPEAGVIVTITDQGQLHSESIVTNSAGNFYSSTPFNFFVPVTVSLRSGAPGALDKAMPGGAPRGGCNAAGCHDASRRLTMPRP